PSASSRRIKESNRPTQSEAQSRGAKLMRSATSRQRSGSPPRMRVAINRRQTPEEARHCLERHDAVRWPFVLPQASERRRAHVPVLRELEEVRLDDNLRFRPEPDVRVDLRDLRERAFLLPQGGEPLAKRPPQLYRTAGADPADGAGG